jgi:hypothetical protein
MFIPLNTTDKWYGILEITKSMFSDIPVSTYISIYNTEKSRDTQLKRHKKTRIARIYTFEIPIQQILEQAKSQPLSMN